MDLKLQETYQLYIDGKWVDASDGATFATYCPANGEKLANCAQATKEDVDDAVKAAWKAFDSWKKTTVNERAAILNKVADIIAGGFDGSLQKDGSIVAELQVITGATNEMGFNKLSAR